MRIYFSLLLAGLLLVSVPAHAAQKIRVVTTQALFGDLVKQIGGEKVEVVSIASPKFNVHFIQPKPSDVRKVAKADLYVNAGLDLEAWSDPLLEAAGKPDLFRSGPHNVDLSQGLRLLNVPKQAVSRSEGDIHLFGNPHFQMDPRNAKMMARTIADKLKETDPDDRQLFEDNLKAFLTKLDQKIAEWKAQCGHCDGKEIISYHDDIAYFVDFLGVKVEQFIEPKPGIPPTPKHQQFLEGYIKMHGIKAIVRPTYQPKDAAEALAKRTGARVVTICQNAGEEPGTEDVFGFFDYNIKQLSEGLR
jgi:zinc/manganese transport system substrate-binding protein